MDFTRRSKALARKQIRNSTGLEYRYLSSVYIRILCNPDKAERKFLFKIFEDLVMFESPCQAYNNVREYFEFDDSIIFC